MSERKRLPATTAYEPYRERIRSGGKFSPLTDDVIKKEIATLVESRLSPHTKTVVHRIQDEDDVVKVLNHRARFCDST
jgi:hypothetical protein